MFPTVYGVEYSFNPSVQGLLYLPMLIGVVLGEFAAGPAGDWATRAPHASAISRWVAKRNTQPKDKDGRVPEMRVLVAFGGVVLSVVRPFLLLSSLWG
jgi:hypothetical protein